ncbi:MAG: PH domain-containing protein [Lachnospiraceae bacterium]|nr:PH domain-containing protein [Lachnospiraceae bacterium]MBQ4069270.1 PH domain-containing protein [Lachnospiraceae bacterium]
MSEVKETQYVWTERKRTIFGLPWSFTKYKLTEEKLMIKSGLFNINEEEIRLYRIMDMTLERSLEQRLFGLGTIKCNSADKSTPIFYIKRIKNSENVKNMLSDMVEQQRERKRVSGREFMSDGLMDDDIM